MNKKVSIFIFIIIILSELVYSYDKTENFRTTQAHYYLDEGDTGQIRIADEFVVDG